MIGRRPMGDPGTTDRIGAAATFQALGTYVYVATRCPEDLPHAESLAAGILADIDETCSRFRTDSDLSLVNRRAGRLVEVDSLLIAALRVALSAAEQTAGLVNPLLGRPIVQLGYDQDFQRLHAIDDSDPTPTPLPPAPPLDAWRDIEIDAAGAIRIPVNTALDLGATGKAWAADVIATAFRQELTAGAIVSVGGDVAIAAAESEEQHDPWPVAISEYPDSTPEEIITLSRGGLATSSSQVRHWTRGGVRRHHLLDPRTGLPCEGKWRTVTATGPSCTAANIASTAAIVLGDAALAWLSAHSVTARLVDSDGGVTPVGAWADHRGHRG